MNFYFIGSDYRDFEIAKREEIYGLRNEISAYWSRFFSQTVVLLTCNRFEVYGISSLPIKRLALAKGWNFIQGEKDVFCHALRVAAGLESQIKGEPQILEQVNFLRSKIPDGLSEIWERVCRDALDIRRESGLISGENIATIIFEDMKKILPLKDELKVAVVGTGRIAGLLAKYRPGQVQLVFASHKNRLAADLLAESSGGKAVFLCDLEGLLVEADFLVSATASPHFILKKEGLEKAALRRKVPLYIYDLAIPRDVQPCSGMVKGVVLKNLDDLSLIFEDYNDKIKDRLLLAEQLVRQRVKEYGRNIEDRSEAEPSLLSAG